VKNGSSVTVQEVGHDASDPTITVIRALCWFFRHLSTALFTNWMHEYVLTKFNFHSQASNLASKLVRKTVNRAGQGLRICLRTSDLNSTLCPARFPCEPFSSKDPGASIFKSPSIIVSRWSIPRWLEKKTQEPWSIHPSTDGERFRDWIERIESKFICETKIVCLENAAVARCTKEKFDWESRILLRF